MDPPTGTMNPRARSPRLVRRVPREQGLRSEADHAALTRVVLITLFVAGNFVRPFAHAQNKVALVLHTVNIFTIPAFDDPATSAPRHRPRRRFLVSTSSSRTSSCSRCTSASSAPILAHVLPQQPSRAGVRRVPSQQRPVLVHYTPQPNWGPSPTTPRCRPVVLLLHPVVLHLAPLRRRGEAHGARPRRARCLFGYTSINRFMGTHRSPCPTFAGTCSVGTRSSSRTPTPGQSSAWR